jgi:hypothetical protein
MVTNIKEFIKGTVNAGIRNYVMPVVFIVGEASAKGGQPASASVCVCVCVCARARARVRACTGCGTGTV